MSYDNLHAHFGYASRDCDGQYTGGHDLLFTDWVEGQKTLNPNFPEDNLNDVRFYDWCFGSLQHFYSFEWEAEMRIYRDDRGRKVAVWSEPTEEGYRSKTVTMCEEDCEVEETWQRDHTAEAAGY